MQSFSRHATVAHESLDLHTYSTISWGHQAYDSERWSICHLQRYHRCAWSRSTKLVYDSPNPSFSLSCYYTTHSGTDCPFRYLEMVPHALLSMSLVLDRSDTSMTFLQASACPIHDMIRLEFDLLTWPPHNSAQGLSPSCPSSSWTFVCVLIQQYLPI